MSWLIILALAGAAFLALIWLLRAPRAGWEAILAALVVGLAGYAFQGQPGFAGSPHKSAESVTLTDAMLVRERQRISGQNGQSSDWQMVADAMSRNGRYADAATILRGVVDKEPDNGDAWLALANALVGHAQGALSPAALYAYRQAEAADPAAPGPPFFLGLAMVRDGRLPEARKLWGGLLARSPKDAAWRPDLEDKLARLDKIMQMAQQMQAGQMPRAQ